jgi:hypothetical protein
MNNDKPQKRVRIVIQEQVLEQLTAARPESISLTSYVNALLQQALRLRALQADNTGESTWK